LPEIVFNLDFSAGSRHKSGCDVTSIDPVSTLRATAFDPKLTVPGRRNLAGGKLDRSVHDG
jgi:hypothetical protein